MRDGLRDAQAYFGERALAYRQSASHANREDLDRMRSWVRARPGEWALDVATGGGHTALALAEAGCAVVATDGTREMIRDHPPLPRVVCDAHRLPFRRASVDIVASRIAPHHFADLPLFAQEAARVLRPGGRLYVFDLTTPEDPAQQAIIDRVERLRDPSHGRSYPTSVWRDAIARAGLRLARLETRASTFPLGPWIERARMPPSAEAELRALLREHPPRALGGYGVTQTGEMRVLRVEILAEAGGSPQGGRGAKLVGQTGGAKVEGRRGR